jgi:hypothetical protein
LFVKIDRVAYIKAIFLLIYEGWPVKKALFLIFFCCFLSLKIDGSSVASECGSDVGYSTDDDPRDLWDRPASFYDLISRKERREWVKSGQEGSISTRGVLRNIKLYGFGSYKGNSSSDGERYAYGFEDSVHVVGPADVANFGVKRDGLLYGSICQFRPRTPDAKERLKSMLDLLDERRREDRWVDDPSSESEYDGDDFEDKSDFYKVNHENSGNGCMTDSPTGDYEQWLIWNPNGTWSAFKWYWNEELIDRAAEKEEEEQWARQVEKWDKEDAEFEAEIEYLTHLAFEDIAQEEASLPLSVQQQEVVHYPQAHFSLGIESVVLSLIDKEKQAIDGAMYMFTNYTIARVFAAKQRNGVAVRLIVDKRTKEIADSLLQILVGAGVKLYCNKLTSGKTGLMHHKFLVFYNNVNNKRLLLTGSYNFTRAAEAENSENIIILDDGPSIEKFIKQFAQITDPSRCVEIEEASAGNKRKYEQAAGAARLSKSARSDDGNSTAIN